MSSIDAHRAARAYDRIAAAYDRQMAGDQWMRALLWRHYLRVFQPGDAVLDVSCGTGLDAVFLARAGMRVTAIDGAPAMIDQLRARAARAGVLERVEARVLDVADLGSRGGRFDGIISAFAGLSTVPDLATFAGDAARLLRPGGRVVIHLLSRFSLWEWLGLLRHGRWSEARSLGRQTERDFPIGGLAVRHYLYAPHEVYRRAFEPTFALCRAYSLGALRPPHHVRRVPPVVVRGLGALEPHLGPHRPFLNWGRFFVLDLALRDDRASPRAEGTR